MTETFEWLVTQEPVAYPAALQQMEARAEAIAEGHAHDLFWLLEHPPLYTAGTSAERSELVDPSRFPVFETGRGGKYTYHGPGQRVVYVVRDLCPHGRDVRRHVWALEEWVIRTLADFGVKGERREGRIGIWIVNQGREEKIAAIGVRVRKWVAFHGLSLNVNPDLSHFSGIIPCGLDGFGVTSLHALGIEADMRAVDAVLAKHRAELFDIE